MPLDLGKGIFNLNYVKEQLSDGHAVRSHRIYHGTVFVGKVICHLSFVLCE
ncbi:hypothetical protein HUN01_20780 [Nostoc edaphicum CCNP1411]|uniref:Uncharacterized protein n=1 Tax=Nostoc edaphicum CCNP1411 TaxID=1472755 RepID=A0A7D7QKQ5_9NOSO|nr:hypothetical protein [Nostoc edaphicum]QMS89901.1 hypothetical protein HUN01_20780 [Nostoc edaphicum CCNP1411]